MASRVTPLAEEEGAEVDGAKEARGVVVLVCGLGICSTSDKLRCDYNMYTLNISEKIRYGIIKSVHIGVKLLYDHEGTTNQDITKGFLTPIVIDSG